RADREVLHHVLAVEDLLAAAALDPEALGDAALLVGPGQGGVLTAKPGHAPSLPSLRRCRGRSRAPGSCTPRRRSAWPRSSRSAARPDAPSPSRAPPRSAR